jgi:hypothetical protein
MPKRTQLSSNRTWYTHVTAHHGLQNILQVLRQRKHNRQRRHAALSKQSPEAAKEISDKDSWPTGRFDVHRKSQVNFSNAPAPFDTFLDMANSETTHTWICFQWDLNKEEEHRPCKFKTKAKRMRMSTC